MAINLIDTDRPRARSFGRRLDDANAPTPRALRYEDPSVEEGKLAELQGYRDTFALLASPQFEFSPSAAGSPRFDPADQTSIAPESSASGPLSGREASEVSDKSFEKHVIQAQDIATPVRVLRTNVEIQVADASSTPQVVQPKSTSRMRLTKRGVRVMVALGFAAAIGVGGIIGGVINAFTPPIETSTVVVEAGDSLWSIASTIAEPGEGVRPVINQIAELNSLNSSEIASGQTLVVPAK